MIAQCNRCHITEKSRMGSVAKDTLGTMSINRWEAQKPLKRKQSITVRDKITNHQIDSWAHCSETSELQFSFQAHGSVPKIHC